MLKGRMVSSSSEESEESTESGSSDESSSSSDEETEQRAALPSSTRISFKKSQLGPLGKAKQEAKAAASRKMPLLSLPSGLHSSQDAISLLTGRHPELEAAESDAVSAMLGIDARELV